VRLTRVRSPALASSVPHAYVAGKQPHIQKERVRTRRRLPIWRASTRHGVCMRVYAPPLVRGVYVHPHTWRHACGSLCVGIQTKGGKPVSSGAPERREQPFYSIPGGKRVARSSRRLRRTTSRRRWRRQCPVSQRRDAIPQRAGDVGGNSRPPEDYHQRTALSREDTRLSPRARVSHGWNGWVGIVRGREARLCVCFRPCRAHRELREKHI